MATNNTNTVTSSNVSQKERSSPRKKVVDATVLLLNNLRTEWQKDANVSEDTKEAVCNVLDIVQGKVVAMRETPDVEETVRTRGPNTKSLMQSIMREHSAAKGKGINLVDMLEELKQCGSKAAPATVRQYLSTFAPLLWKRDGNGFYTATNVDAGGSED